MLTFVFVGFGEGGGSVCARLRVVSAVPPLPRCAALCYVEVYNNMGQYLNIII